MVAAQSGDWLHDCAVTVSINGCSTVGGLVARLCCHRFHKWLQCLTPVIDKLGEHTLISWCSGAAFTF